MYKNYSISICLCTYNGKKFISELLNSIFRQTLLPDEIIVCDDNSSDNTLEIIYSQAILHKNIKWKIFRNTENKGWKINFHSAISKAEGDLIFLCDQDDIWDENKIKVMASYWNEDILVLTCNVTQFFPNKKIPVIRYSVNNTFDIDKIENKFDLLYCKRPGCSFCISNKIVTLYNSSWKHNFAHDRLLWMLAFLKGGLYKINYNGVLYRRHGDNASYINYQKFSKTKRRVYFENINLSREYIESILKTNDDNYINVNPIVDRLVERQPGVTRYTLRRTVTKVIELNGGERINPRGVYRVEKILKN